MGDKTKIYNVQLRCSLLIRCVGLLGRSEYFQPLL
jgi:hypothetical protein